MMRNIMEFEGMIARIDEQETVLTALGQGDLAPLMLHYGRRYLNADDTYRRNPNGVSLANLQITALNVRANRALSLYQHYMSTQTALFQADKAAILAGQKLHDNFTGNSGDVPVSEARTDLLGKADRQRRIFTRTSAKLLELGQDIKLLLQAADILSRPDMAVPPLMVAEDLLEAHVKLQDATLDRMGDLLVRELLDTPHPEQQPAWEQLLQLAQDTMMHTRLVQSLLPDADAAPAAKRVLSCKQA